MSTKRNQRRLPSPPPENKDENKSKLNLNDSSLTRQEFNDACVLANHRVYNSGVANVDGIRVPVKSNWNLDYLERKLQNYENNQIIELLKYSFPLENNQIDNRLNHDKPQNHKGATQFPDQIDAYISKELSKGTLIGPFKVNPFPGRACFSPMNTRPKRESDDRRIIMDLSFPDGASVNEFINKDFYRGKNVVLKLPGVKSLVDLIIKLGKNQKILLFKRDLSGAYKQIPVCIGDIHLLGYTHRGLMYFDITLPQGLRNSCLICQMVTDMLMYIYRQFGYDGVNYLDDMGDAQIQSKAYQAYFTLKQILQQAGAVEALAKATPPAEKMLFLGLEINTKTMQIRISNERMYEIRSELNMWRYRTTATKRQIQSLVGKLNFCATVVRSGRLFFSRILNTLRAMSNEQEIELSEEFQRDINWWISLLPDFNGISVIPDEKWVGPNKIFSTDASLVALGGWSEGEYFYSPFPVQFTFAMKLHINELECLAVMVGLKIWAFKAAGQNILIQCDNENAVQIINSGKTKNLFSQNVVREIAYICALNDCSVRAIHVPSAKNRIADCLSRIPLDVQYLHKFTKITRGWNRFRHHITAKHFQFSHSW